MENEHISGIRAKDIATRIKGSGVFLGTQDWLDQNSVSQDEYDAFFDYAVERAAQLDWLDRHRDEEAELCPTKASLEAVNIKTGKVVLQFELAPGHAKDIPALAMLTGQTLYVELYPEQMPLPMEEGDDEAMCDPIDGVVF